MQLFKASSYTTENNTHALEQDIKPGLRLPPPCKTKVRLQHPFISTMQSLSWPTPKPGEDQALPTELGDSNTYFNSAAFKLT